MTKIQVDNNGKAIMLNNKALVASEGGVTPTGTLSITANGVYDVTNYASANVSVSGGSGQTPPYQGTAIMLRCEESLSGATMHYYNNMTGEDFEYTIIDSTLYEGLYYTSIVISSLIVDIEGLLVTEITITMPDGRSNNATLLNDEEGYPACSFYIGFPAA